MNMNLKEAQNHIAELFAQCDTRLKDAKIILRDDALNQATVFHCKLKLVADKPHTQITIQLTSLATQMFLDADNVALEKLDLRFQYVVRKVLKESYWETDSRDEPFVIRIEDYNLN